MLRLDREKRGDVTVLHVREITRLDAASSDAFKKAVMGALEDDDTKIVMDISPLKHIDSAGLAAFISIFKHLSARKGTLKVAGAASPVESMFRLTRLHRVFDVVSSVEDAVESLKGKE